MDNHGVNYNTNALRTTNSALLAIMKWLYTYTPNRYNA